MFVFSHATRSFWKRTKAHKGLLFVTYHIYDLRTSILVIDMTIDKGG